MYVSGYIESWSDSSASDFKRTFDELVGSTASTIEVVFLNCRGGDVFEGLPSFNLIKASPKPVRTVVTGYAASMGAYLFLAANERLMAPFSRLMLHAASMSTGGTADELRAAAEQLDSINKDLIKLTSEATGKTEDEVKAAYFDGSDHWVSATDAVAAGLATGTTTDGLLSSDPVAKAPKANYYNEYDVRIAAALQDFNQPTEMNKKKALIVAALMRANPKAALAPDCDEDAILMEVTAQVDALVAAKARIEALEAAAKIVEEARVKALIDDAVGANKITEGDRDVYTKLAAADYVSTAAILAKMTAHKSITGQLNKDGQPVGDEFKGKTFKEITAMKGGPEYLAKLQTSDVDKFNRMKASFNEVVD